MPKRVRLQGDLFHPIVPEGAVDVTRRGILKGLYGNPYTVKKYGREEALRLYEERFHVFGSSEHFLLWQNIDILKGKDLACWCKPDEKCHADILLTWVAGWTTQSDGIRK